MFNPLLLSQRLKEIGNTLANKYWGGSDNIPKDNDDMRQAISHLYVLIPEKLNVRSPMKGNSRCSFAPNT